MKKILFTRLPAFDDVLPAFAFTSFLVYGRALFVFIWRFPSWIKLLTVPEMLYILSYSFSFNLIEAIVIMLAMLVIGFILPPAWFRDSFIASSVWVVSVCLGSLMILFGRLDILMPDISDIIWRWTGVTVILAVLAAIAVPRLRFMRSAALWFADRSVVFLYIFLPASLLGLVVTAVRNIF